MKRNVWRMQMAVGLVVVCFCVGCREQRSPTQQKAPPTQTQKRPDKKAESTTDLPEGWKLDEIAKAAHPSAGAANTCVLAWKIEEDDTLRVEQCLVLCQLEKGRWFLVALFRHPKAEERPEWERSRVHVTPDDPRMRGGWVWHYRSFDKRPSNKEIYESMDEFRWRLGADDGFKLLSAKVCTSTWEAAIQEKPTRFFSKEK